MFKSENELKDYMKQFLKNSSYLEDHSERFFKSYELIKDYSQNFDKEVLVDLASANGIFVPVIHAISPFKQFHIVDYGNKDVENINIQSSTEVIHVKKHYLNLEKDHLPFENESVDVVIFFEILEHLLYDPMHAFLEINRVLKKDGFLFISTPNLNSAKAFQKMLRGNNPNLYTPYRELEKVYERHNREFTIKEVELLTSKSGFSIDKVVTHPVTNNKIAFFLSILKSVGLSNIKKDELGTFMYVACQKKRHLDIEKVDSDTRFPAPVYNIKK